MKRIFDKIEFVLAMVFYSPFIILDYLIGSYDNSTEYAASNWRE